MPRRSASPPRPPALFRLATPPRGVEPRPVLVDVPHAGEHEPAALAATLTLPFAARRADLDLYVDRLWRAAPRLGARLLVATHSRYVVDLNRAADDADAGSVEGSARPAGELRRGVVWQVTGDDRPVLARPLTRAAFADRLARWYAPYHARLEHELAALQARFGHVVLLDAHSMPAWARTPGERPGRRADIVPGDDGGRACAPSLLALCVEVFAGHGFSVAPNAPYKGGFITRHHGRPEAGRHALQVEINRGLYMDEGSLRMAVGEPVERLRRATEELVRRVGLWRP